VRGTVDELVDGKVVIVRSINDPEDRDEAEYPRIRGFNVDVGEDVYALSLGDGQQLLVLGALQNSAATAYELDAQLEVPYLIVTNGGSIVIDADLHVGDDAFITGDLTAAGITGSSFNSPLVQTEAQSASDAASTTSTVNYSVGMSADIALPTGTWSLHVQGGLAMQHSAGSTVNMLVAIDGEDGTARSLAANASTHQTIVSEHQRTGRTGTIACAVKFKSSAAGTTSARNPWLIIIARRTA
jgi:hypothetical protein